MAEIKTLSGTIVGVSRDKLHRFSKRPVSAIELEAGSGVIGDGHWGVTVQHRSRVAVDPTQPNLRQVHLIQAELFVELADEGFLIKAGDLGENITTSGIDLLGLPKGSLLHLGAAVLELTGLRNPCAQIERFRSGLLRTVLNQGPDGTLIRKAGVMAIVHTGGTVQPGDSVTVELPAQPHRALERV